MKEPGEVVRAGQMLALCESPEASRLKGEYLEACADADMHAKDQKRQEELFTRNLIDAATYEQSQSEAKSAEARRQRSEGELRALGLDDADLEEVRAGKLTARFALRSPSSGTLVERSAPLGVALEEGTELATVADPNDLWIEARVRDSDLRRIEHGQTAVFSTEGAHLDRLESRVIWISQYLDPLTRTGVVRAKPVADASNLRANQFGHLDFIDRSAELSVLVPRDAVQWEGCCHVVFVREAQDRYRPRKVTIAKADNAHYRVTSGLSAEEWVVVHGSFLLKTELKKSSIGAGCCGLEAKS
jgi:cobalt-zinc-cadmium efflux system membrane fusion protein